MATIYTPDSMADLQQLTRDYASFSRSRSGLGNVLGGLVGLIVFLGVWLLGPGLPSAMLTVGLTFVWLIGREIIRRRLYRRYGQAQEIWNGTLRHSHRVWTLVLTVCLLAFAVWIVLAGRWSQSVAWPYLLFCLLTPVILWRSLFTVPEMVMGFGLLFMCAITASGHMPMLLGLLIVPAYALALIPLGLAEHRQFRSLEARLRARGEVDA